MRRNRSTNIRALYGLMALVVILQAIAIGLTLRFEGDRQKRDGALLDRTSVMLSDIFPSIQSELALVSQTATEIKKEALGLKESVAKMDQHVGDVGRDVLQASSRMENIAQQFTSFFQDKSGLIWGHSLNPYVLALLLGIILLAIPACSWLFWRRNNSPEPAEETAVPVEVELPEIPADRVKSDEPVLCEPTDRYIFVGPELKKVMDETERMIVAARHENDAMHRKQRPDSHTSSDSKVLH
ncbi:hypothetical protein [Desulfomonile tiedjei]|uniref:Uncharacterized protein n=1 Tax=Desulfomonile tiedjei (strain ATCC 49306 / DSM 6799 / DCB-1) TaxID=706587 RepID=I4C768_DESTA|nr:hypothetical protein [Desulfomonile tiedjei]AFM25409.1 hypothetical protein Desti_2732 [Desulfomonile tiedjei DSM 6799]